LFTSKNSVETKASIFNKWKAEGLRVIVGDLSKDSDVLLAYEGVDTVISALGRDALQHQFNLIKLAEETESVKWFLPSEYGTDIEHNPKSGNEKPHQTKLKVRKYINDNVKRLKVTYVVTGPYFDMWVDTVAGIEVVGGFQVDAKKAYVIGEGEGKVGFCTMRDVGKFVLETLRHPAESFGKALKVQSFVVTANEVLAEYEKQTGSTWTVTKTPLAEIVRLEEQLWNSDHPKKTSATLRRIWAEGGTLYAKNDNGTIGLAPGDLDPLELAVKKALGGGYKADPV